MKKLVLSFMFLFSVSLYAQKILSPATVDWTKMTDNNPEATFYQVQDDFEQHWAGKKITKGCGYKPFKRWEAYMAPRVYPTGNMILPHTNYQNFIAWEAQQPMGKPS